jgi:hypothetical protein
VPEKAWGFEQSGQRYEDDEICKARKRIVIFTII